MYGKGRHGMSIGDLVKWYTDGRWFSRKRRGGRHTEYLCCHRYAAVYVGRSGIRQKIGQILGSISQDLGCSANPSPLQPVSIFDVGKMDGERKKGERGREEKATWRNKEEREKRVGVDLGAYREKNRKRHYQPSLRSELSKKYHCWTICVSNIAREDFFALMLSTFLCITIGKKGPFQQSMASFVMVWFVDVQITSCSLTQRGGRERIIVVRISL